MMEYVNDEIALAQKSETLREVKRLAEQELRDKYVPLGRCVGKTIAKQYEDYGGVLFLGFTDGTYTYFSGENGNEWVANHPLRVSQTTAKEYLSEGAKSALENAQAEYDQLKAQSDEQRQVEELARYSLKELQQAVVNKLEELHGG